MQQNDICGVCGATMEKPAEDVAVKCGICGKEAKVKINCPNGHYVCPECGSLSAAQVLEKVINSSTSKSPMEILEQVMAHPKLNMHGTDHHYIVPVVIVAAARNAGYQVPVEAVQQAVQRGQQVPGGW